MRSLSPANATDFMPDSELYYLVEGSVYDGDTLRVQRNGEELKIRLCGIDAPEIEQPMGTESRDHLRSLINQGFEDGRLIVLPVDQDQYGRTVAEIFVPLENTEAEIHLTSQMVLDGFAYHYERYSGGCPNGQFLAGAEEQARSQQSGVWANPNAVKPWDYRR
jgi:endonuclease YncB( thermonuclease family)